MQVGHELAALSDARTFNSLYVEPLVNIVERENPQNEFTTNQTGLKYARLSYHLCIH